MQCASDNTQLSSPLFIHWVELRRFNALYIMFLASRPKGYRLPQNFTSSLGSNGSSMTRVGRNDGKVEPLSSLPCCCNA
jgi:hypothetical protein